MVIQRKIISLSLLLCVSLSSFSQTLQQSFIKAEELYKEGNYTEALAKAKSVQKRLGASNPRIESLLFMCYYNTNQLVKAKVSFEKLKKLTGVSGQEKESFQQYASIGASVTETLNKKETIFQEERKAKRNAETKKFLATVIKHYTAKVESLKQANDVQQKEFGEQKLYQEAKQNKTVQAYKKYLREYPYGQFKSEISKLLKYQEEVDAWANAKRWNSTSSYYQYLDKYAYGKYATTAKEAIKKWDKEAYTKAVELDTQRSLKYYLNNYPRGGYKEAVNSKLKIRIEKNTFNFAKENDDISSYENYLSKYPYGLYVKEVDEILKDKYYLEGKKFYESQRYYEAKKMFDKYITKFPNTIKTKEVNKMLKVAARKLKQRTSKFLMATYEGDQIFGLSYGKLNKTNKLGYYFNLRVNKDFLNSFDNLPTVKNIDKNTSLAGETSLTENNIVVAIPPNVEPQEIGTAIFSGGVTFKITYPLWLSFGGGVTYNRVFNLGGVFDRTNFNFLDEKKFLNLDETGFTFFPEVGLNFKIEEVLIIKYGVMYQNKLIHQFGVGISF